MTHWVSEGWKTAARRFLSCSLQLTEAILKELFLKRFHSGGDVAQLVALQVWCTTDVGSTPWCSKGFISPVNFQCRLSCGICTAPAFYHMQEPVCAPLTSQTLLATPLFGHTEIQHTPGQPLEMECGCPSGRGTENDHTFCFPKKKMYCLH